MLSINLLINKLIINFHFKLVKCQGQKIKNQQKDLTTRDIHVKYQSSSTHFSKVISKIKVLNKRPMGHIAHLRKQFKSINTYDYIITLIKRRKKTLLTLWEFIGSSFQKKHESPSPKDALCQDWVKLAQWFWRRRFLNLSMYFHYFVIISPLKLSLIHIWRCRRYAVCRSRWSPYH